MAWDGELAEVRTGILRFMSDEELAAFRDTPEQQRRWKIKPVMAIDDAQKTDESPGAVSQRVSDVIMDIYHGRTTPQQNKAIGAEVERSGRVKAGSDKAVGKAIGGG